MTDDTAVIRYPQVRGMNITTYNDDDKQCESYNHISRV